MANVASAMCWPSPTWSGAGLITLDASGEKFAFCFLAPKAGDISAIIWRTGAVVQGDTMLVSLQDLDASGDPDGTADQSATQVVADTDDNTWFRTVLGSNRTVTAGDALAVVIEFNSWTAGNDVDVYQQATGLPTSRTNYVDHYTSSWSKKNTSAAALGFEYSDGSFAIVPDAIPAERASWLYNSTSAPDEYALRFQTNGPVAVSAFEFYADLDGDFDAVLYDSDGTTVLASTSVDKDMRSTTAVALHLVTFPEVELSKATTYRMAIKPTTSTSLRLYHWLMNDTASQAASRDAILTQECYGSSRTDGGSWSDDSARVPMCRMIMTGVDDATGGGGGGTTVPQGLHPIGDGITA